MTTSEIALQLAKKFRSEANSFLITLAIPKKRRKN